MAIDIFTCGKTDPHDVLRYMQEDVDLGHVTIRRCGRFEVESPAYEDTAADSVATEDSRDATAVTS